MTAPNIHGTYLPALKTHLPFGRPEHSTSNQHDRRGAGFHRGTSAPAEAAADCPTVASPSFRACRVGGMSSRCLSPFSSREPHTQVVPAGENTTRPVRCCKQGRSENSYILWGAAAVGAASAPRPHSK